MAADLAVQLVGPMDNKMVALRAVRLAAVKVAMMAGMMDRQRVVYLVGY